MSEENKETRVSRNKNRGRSNMIMKLAIGLVALIAIVVLLESFIGGSNGNENPDQLAGNTSSSESSMIIQDRSEEEESSNEEEPEEESSVPEEGESDESEDDEEETELREIDSNDPNVIRAFSGDWEPVGTEQAEPHVTNYEDGSADRIEIKRASSIATGVAENDMIEHWVGNNGDQKVTATISEISSGDIFKVYLTWIPREGWQVTHYEELHQMVQ